MRTWTFPEVRPPGDGPWQTEPDKAQWVDEATGLDCLIVRSGNSGSLCGYVGVPPGHPWHGVHYDEIDPEPTSHGGLTFSDFCQDGVEDGPGVCHVPEPGRPANVWWVGFDTAHADDVTPLADARLAEIGVDLPSLSSDLFPRCYRTFGYVRANVLALALQCDDWDGTGRGWRTAVATA